MADAVRPEYQNQSNGMLQRANTNAEFQGIAQGIAQWPQGNYPYWCPYAHPVVVGTPLPQGLLNQKAKDERDKIVSIIGAAVQEGNECYVEQELGEKAIEALVKAGYEVIRV